METDHELRLKKTLARRCNSSSASLTSKKNKEGATALNRLVPAGAQKHSVETGTTAAHIPYMSPLGYFLLLIEHFGLVGYNLHPHPAPSVVFTAGLLPSLLATNPSTTPKQLTGRRRRQETATVNDPYELLHFQPQAYHKRNRCSSIAAQTTAVQLNRPRKKHKNGHAQGTHLPRQMFTEEVIGYAPLPLCASKSRLVFCSFKL